MSWQASSKTSPSHQASGPGQSLPALMWSRFITLWRLKLMMTIIIAPIFVFSYLGIQRLIEAPHFLAYIWIDDLAGFDVGWVYIYVSQYLIVPLPPLLAHTRDQLRRLVVGLSITSGLAFATFLIYPVAILRPAKPEDSNWIYDWLVSVDTPANAFPSLHVGLSMLAALYAHRVLDEAFSRKARLALLLLIWVWTVLIAWSTMATKQHYFYDVLGGIVVAVAGHVIAWRGVPLPQLEVKPA